MPAATSRLQPGLVICAALSYCGWLGWHWLPLDFSGGEFDGFVSRVWDVRRELLAHHSLPWWTPYFMGGSSYGLNHSQGLYLVPALALSAFFDPLVAVKLTALLAIFVAGVGMYFCARHFLRSPWAAALSAVAFLLHPELVTRATSAEHLGFSLFTAFVPLTWLFFARALESGRFADLFACSLALAGSAWANNKMALVNALFLAGYFVYWVAWGREPAGTGWRQRARSGVRQSLLIAALAFSVGAFFIAPGIAEAKYVKLFAGEPLLEWQEAFSFKSLFALVDRDGAVTRDAIEHVSTSVAARGGVRSPEEYKQVLRVLSLDTQSPWKYAGIVTLGLLAAAVLANRRRENRSLFWFLVAAFLASIALAYGRSSVWEANAVTWMAVMQFEGMPGSVKIAFGLALIAALLFAVRLYRRKLDTPRKRLVAAAALLAFLLLPLFPLVASLPLFGEIRSPFVFYDVTAAFLGALLAGFFVTDVVERRVPLTVGLVALLLLADFWPYQQWAKASPVAARTLANLRADAGALRADTDLVKVYVISRRGVRLQWPMLSGKPLLYEDFFNWMAPKGIGYLNMQANGEPALFNATGTRYIVFDKSDPRMAGTEHVLQFYRTLYPVQREDADFVVFRNPGARPYLSAYADAMRFDGDPAESVKLTLALAEKNWPLIQAPSDSRESFRATYASAEPAALPTEQGRAVPLRVEQLTRENAGRLRAIVAPLEPCWLVINESYYPYWRASLAGRAIPVYRAWTGLMAVRLPAGRQELTLQYSPPGIYFAAQAWSGGALLLGFLLCGLQWRRTRGQRSTLRQSADSRTNHLDAPEPTA